MILSIVSAVLQWITIGLSITGLAIASDARRGLYPYDDTEVSSKTIYVIRYTVIA